MRPTQILKQSALILLLLLAAALVLGRFYPAASPVPFLIAIVVILITPIRMLVARRRMKQAEAPAPASVETPAPASADKPAKPARAKKCVLCGKSHHLAPIDADGYCPTCAKQHAEYMQRQQREAAERKRKEEAEQAQIDAIPEYEIVPSDAPRKRNTGYEPVAFSNITPKGRYDDIVVFDTETTGLGPSRDRIVELAAIKYADGRPVSRFHSYVNPGRPIPPEATKINGITDEMVAGAPVIGAILPAFEAFVGDSTLVAHNLDFDLRFIYYSGSQITETKRKYIDTLEQAQKMLNKPRDVCDHKLDTLCDYYRITIAGRHNALGDAYATGKLFFRLVDEKQNA